MKDYELSVLFHPDLEMNLDPALDKVKKIIENNGGKITKEELDGKKRMSYQVGKQEYAVYYYFDVSLPPEAPNKIYNTLNIADEVLRCMVVKADANRAKTMARQAELAEADEAEDVEGGGNADDVEGADGVDGGTKDVADAKSEATDKGAEDINEKK
ncbi:30S ribosomal protein S6 [Candidatus Saccharibacteria bacterium]|nr:30S ribosomal protein S6 [Candidatus Saccharibacteria bacterium]